MVNLRAFESIYNHVYEQMVAAKVAAKLEDEAMHDDDSNLTKNRREMVGRKSKFKLKHHKNILFVDETGCNTNLKQDGRLGGALFFVPSGPSPRGLHGCTNDVPFTVF